MFDLGFEFLIFLVFGSELADIGGIRMFTAVFARLRVSTLC